MRFKTPRPGSMRAIGLALALLFTPACGTAADPPPPELEASWADEDWAVFETVAERAWAEGVEALEPGAAVARVGRWFVGTPYEPQTLEQPGPERVVINLRALDCVTFVENVLAIVDFVRAHDPGILADRERAQAEYVRSLARWRYRDEIPEGYASRLHYFSDWLGVHDARGALELVTADLGGEVDPEPVYFMSAHPDAYPALANAGELQRIREVERTLNTSGQRIRLSENAISDVADRIAEGDVIAATSTVAGLDVAHTGIAVRVDGALHLLHAPLVGDSVEISRRPLAERILSIEAQDGIMVARPRLSPPTK